MICFNMPNTFKDFRRRQGSFQDVPNYLTLFLPRGWVWSPPQIQAGLRRSPIVSKTQRGVMTREVPGKARALRHLHGILDGVVTTCSLLGHSCHTGVHIQFLRSAVPAEPCLPAAATKARNDPLVPTAQLNLGAECKSVSTGGNRVLCYHASFRFDRVLSELCRSQRLLSLWKQVDPQAPAFP